MDNENDVQLPSNFGVGITVLLLWVWLVPGISSLINKHYDWTTFLLLALSIVLVVAAIRSKKLFKLEGRKFERSRIMVTLGLFFATSLYYLYELLRPRISVAADATFWRFHSLVTLIFLGFVIWQIVVSLRAHVSTEE